MRRAAVRTHAEFPVEGTEQSRGDVAVAFGTFPATKYVVQGTDEQGRATVRTFWFADAIPGPPVRMAVAVAGAQVSESEMVERSGFGE